MARTLCLKLFFELYTRLTTLSRRRVQDTVARFDRCPHIYNSIVVGCAASFVKLIIKYCIHAKSID